jgi:phosphoribosylformylglycinamidine synthase subunit PurQ / glutaminase
VRERVHRRIHMSRPTAIVVAGPGTNRDGDALLALDLAGAEPSVVLAGELTADPGRLDEARIVVVAGGFSYGDALGAGRVLALDLTLGDGGRLGDRLRHFVASGRPVIGICNGFQVLTRAGLLPGALGHNEQGRFDCRWVELAAEPASACIWTSGLDDPVHCPIAHGEGRYVHPEPAALAAAGQVALRYAAVNPNGSVADIAGVCDPTGVVLGLMPHPENHVVVRQHPRHRHGGPETSRFLGLRLFENAVRHVK